jgi:glucose-6-phosphate 1-dehydrogenase
MPIIEPHIAATRDFCQEIPAPPAAIVVFGASGDLTRRKLLGGLFELYKRRLLGEQFYMIGCGRTEYSDEAFRKLACDIFKSNDKLANEFAKHLHYVSGDYDDAAFYSSIRSRLAELDKIHRQDGCYIFYLAVPPTVFSKAIENLGKSGFAYGQAEDPSQCCRLVIEKPFGRDYESAVALNQHIHRYFNESQVYRIDHYLAKETVQNILVFRFGNAIFEPIWNRNYIDHIQITIAESLGVEHRAGYYEQAGALRDMFQNHMLQMLTLTAMEPPTSFKADDVRDEKTRLLRSIRPFEASGGDIVRGQYASGTLDGRPLVGYRQEEGVAPQSKIETFVAARLLIDNWRWKGVPFYLRTGKRLARRLSEVAVTFKKVPHSMFESIGIGEMASNVLVFEIQPDEGISLSFEAKSPGSKTCISTLAMDFTYKNVFGIETPDAYQRVLLDCMSGDQTLFTRHDDVEIAWQLLTPVLQAWQNDPSRPYEYPAGSGSFPAADKLIESDGRKWRAI